MESHCCWLLGCRHSAGLLSCTGALPRCSSKGLLLHGSNKPLDQPEPAREEYIRPTIPSQRQIALFCFLMMQREDRHIKEKEIIELGMNGEEESQRGLFFLASPHTACLHLTGPVCCISGQVQCPFFFNPLYQLPISFSNDLEPSPSLLLLSPFLTIVLAGHWPSLFRPLPSSALLWFNSSYCIGTWPRTSCHHCGPFPSLQLSLTHS